MEWIDVKDEPIPEDWLKVLKIVTPTAGHYYIPENPSQYQKYMITTLIKEATHWVKKEPPDPTKHKRRGAYKRKKTK